jgi:predicted metal-dependent phosphotriesterase family hydrolase
MATDFGQWRNPHPIEGMRHFIHLMMQMGITESEIDIMTKENPARLLGLI